MTQARHSHAAPHQASAASACGTVAAIVQAVACTSQVQRHALVTAAASLHELDHVTTQLLPVALVLQANTAPLM